MCHLTTPPMCHLRMLRSHQTNERTREHQYDAYTSRVLHTELQRFRLHIHRNACAVLCVAHYCEPALSSSLRATHTHSIHFSSRFFLSLHEEWTRALISRSARLLLHSSYCWCHAVFFFHTHFTRRSRRAGSRFGALRKIQYKRWRYIRNSRKNSTIHTAHTVRHTGNIHSCCDPE